VGLSLELALEVLVSFESFDVKCTRLPKRVTNCVLKALHGGTHCNPSSWEAKARYQWLTSVILATQEGRDQEDHVS
jgi:hypothetical protein